MGLDREIPTEITPDTNNVELAEKMRENCISKRHQVWNDIRDKTPLSKCLRHDTICKGCSHPLDVVEGLTIDGLPVVVVDDDFYEFLLEESAYTDGMLDIDLLAIYYDEWEKQNT